MALERKILLTVQTVAKNYYLLVSALHLLHNYFCGAIVISFLTKRSILFKTKGSTILKGT